MFFLAGLMLSCGDCNKFVAKQHGEPTLYGNPTPSDAPHVRYVYSSCSTKPAQHECCKHFVGSY